MVKRLNYPLLVIAQLTEASFGHVYAFCVSDFLMRNYTKKANKSGHYTSSTEGITMVESFYGLSVSGSICHGENSTCLMDHRSHRARKI